MWHRRLGGSLLFFLLELIECSIGMTPDLTWIWLRKRFRFVTGASSDLQEDEQTHHHGDPTLLHPAPSMIHLRPLPSGDVELLFKCPSQIIDRLHDTSIYGLAPPSLRIDIV